MSGGGDPADADGTVDPADGDRGIDPEGTYPAIDPEDADLAVDPEGADRTVDPASGHLAVDLAGADPAAVARAVEAGELPDPGPVHDHVDPLVAECSPSVRSALAAAARTRGLTPPQADRLRAVRAELESLDPDPVEAEPVRRRVAEAGEREAGLDERVAELRGWVRAREEAGLDATAAQRRLEAAVADLSEARTERIAAEQALERVRERARDRRDRRERRLRLEDRLGNLRRAARADLAAACWEPFREAVAAVPGEGTAGEEPGSYEGDPVTAALAVVRVADLAAPVVLACGRFPDAGTAAERLAAPVIRVDDAGRG